MLYLDFSLTFVMNIPIFSTTQIYTIQTPQNKNVCNTSSKHPALTRTHNLSSTRPSHGRQNQSPLSALFFSLFGLPGPGTTIKFTSVTCNTVVRHRELRSLFCLTSFNPGSTSPPWHRYFHLLIVELPCLATHRALLICLRVEPLYDAVHVEAMRTGSPN